MDPIIFFGILTVIYMVLFFFDRFFKSCMHYPYEALLRNTGISIGFLKIKWHTNAFNRLVLRWSSSCNSCTRNVLTKSFNIGVVICFSLLPIGLILLIITIFTSGSHTKSISHPDELAAAQTPTATKAQNLELKILLPGVNLPIDEIGYYVASLLFCTVVHELGHAIAAVLEDVPITGFGVQVYYCLPFAFTELSYDHLNSLSLFRKLRILCGGVWHNFIFVALCYLLVSTLHITIAPFYDVNKGVIVTEMTQFSPLKSNNEKGLMVGNIVTQINDCPVINEETWYNCLKSSMYTKPGFCVSSDFIRLNDESIDTSHHSDDGLLQCCNDKNFKVCCFEYVDDFNNDAPLEIPQHVCLDIRKTVENSYEFCGYAGICGRGFCLRPLLKNLTTILSLQRYNDRRQPLKDVVYLGYATDISRTIKISSYIPKGSFLPSYLADIYSLFLRYNIVFSIGCALINAVPCFGLDGHHIVNAIVNSFLINRFKERPKRDFIGFIVSGVGTFLFSLALLKVCASSIFNYFI